MYYYMSDLQFPERLKIIVIGIDYIHFIKIGYVCGCILSVYIDHLGMNLHNWLNDEKVEVRSPEDEHSSVYGFSR